VLGIPRGGVVVAAELALRLNAELDIVLARKLRTPYHGELAMGAIAEDGQTFLNEYADLLTGELQGRIGPEIDKQTRELSRCKQLYRTVRPRAPMVGRSVILTDDGVATGATMLAAIEMIKAEQPRELILALPVAPPKSVALLEPLCQRLVCLVTTDNFGALSLYYLFFEQVTDQRVVELLQASRAPCRA